MTPHPSKLERVIDREVAADAFGDSYPDSADPMFCDGDCGECAAWEWYQDNVLCPEPMDDSYDAWYEAGLADA